ncbi:MAG: zinc ribbon domain-containing protein [Armatimonadota bacterium]
MTVGRDEIEVGDAAQEGEGATFSYACLRCGARVPPESTSCPNCGGPVHRICTCGWHLPSGENTCPNCGATYPRNVRQKRKSRSRTIRRKRALRYALGGAVVALIAAAAIHLLITSLALVAVEDRAALPSDLVSRVGLAADGLAQMVGNAAHRIGRYLRPLLTVLGVMAIGAAGGVAYYVLSLRLRSRRRSNSSSSRKVRRKRRRV